MLLQTSTSPQIQEILEAVSSGFWTKFDFYLFLLLTLSGIYLSWRGLQYSKSAYVEAEQAKNAATAAKEAANKAGKTVKKQSILLAISETTRLIGQIRQNTNYDDTYNKLMEINGKIRGIIGFYRGDLGPNHQDLLQQIETCVSTVMVEFNLLDPEDESKQIYNKVRPNIILLSGHLNELQGVLENELISNN